MDKRIIYAGIGLLVGLAGGVLLASLKQDEPADEAAAPQGKIAASDVDRQFIEQMIPHHEGAIVMAELALEKAARPELASLAADIVSAQTSENDAMRGWYEEWFGVPVPAEAHPVIHAEGAMGDLEALRAAPDFDIEFLRQMIAHHEMAVNMAVTLKNTTARPEMESLAEHVMASQASEIAMMQGWLSEWQDGAN